MSEEEEEVIRWPDEDADGNKSKFDEPEVGLSPGPLLMTRSARSGLSHEPVHILGKPSERCGLYH
jgi:hypothetical protein